MAEANGGSSDATPGYRVRWVFGNITDALRRQIMAFWMREGAVAHPDEAWRRSWEVACVLEDDASGDIAGICTVAIGLDDEARSYGLLRIFVAAANRHPGLNVRMMRKLIEGFEVLASEPGAPRRLLAIIENRKIERRGGQRLLASIGFSPAGRTPGGELLIQRWLTV